MARVVPADQLKSDLPGLRNRCRVWYIINSIIELARLERSECLISTIEQNTNTNPPLSQVTGDIKFDEIEVHWRPFEQGCHSLRTIIVQVLEFLWKIGVSTFDFNTASYLTGFRFVADRTSDICIGYITRSEAFFTLQELFGFKVAVAPSGLRAVQIVGKNSHMSPWLGSPSSVPVSERLIRSHAIEAVTIRLDMSDSNVVKCIS